MARSTRATSTNDARPRVLVPDTLSATHIRRAVKHLRTVDTVLRDLIDRVGPFKLKLERNRFQMLARSIISQQISTGAARSIRKRVEGLVAPRRLTAEAIARLTLPQLQGAGLSRQKADYLLGLAKAVEQGTLRLDRVSRLPDEDVIAELVKLRGVGRWTAQMFLIFSLGRLDVMPEDDFGVRTAIQRLYGLEQLPDKGAIREITAAWRPYATVASWYCWRSLETKPVVTKDTKWP